MYSICIDIASGHTVCGKPQNYVVELLTTVNVQHEYPKTTLRYYVVRQAKAVFFSSEAIFYDDFYGMLR